MFANRSQRTVASSFVAMIGFALVFVYGRHPAPGQDAGEPLRAANVSATQSNELDSNAEPSPPIVLDSGDSRISMVDSSSPEVLKFDRAQADKLAAVIPHIDFVKTPLSEALDSIREAAGLNVVADFNALAALGIDRSAPVTLHLTGETGDLALQWVLRNVALASHSIDFEIQGGAVVISTCNELQQDVGTHVYDVKDILSPLSPLTRVGLVNGATPAEMLCELIQDSIMPDTWRTNGGEFGSALVLGTNLVVTQTRSGQEQVVNLLTKLRHPEPPPN